MKLLSVLLLSLLICGCDRVNGFPSKGEIQCPVGLQTLGCQFTALARFDKQYIATCEFPVKGTLVCPTASAVIVALAAPAVSEPEATK